MISMNVKKHLVYGLMSFAVAFGSGGIDLCAAPAPPGMYIKGHGGAKHDGKHGNTRHQPPKSHNHGRPHGHHRYPQAYGWIVDGHNVYHGIYEYRGARYPFRVVLDYDARTGRVYNAAYIPEGYSGKTRLTKILFNGTSLKMEGANTRIIVERKGHGVFGGMMHRGQHSGVVTMSLAR